VHLVLPVTHAWPLHTVDGTRALERQAQAALPPHALMARAGAAVARLALAVAPHARRVHIAAGAGNNGGDGLIAAIHLRAAGKDVRVSLHGDASRLPPDAADALAQAVRHGVPIAMNPSTFIADSNEAPLIVDALLGIGTRGAPRDPVAAVIATINASAARVLAIDTPSGLDADTGQAAGAVVRADHTLSLLSLKPGLFTASGRDAAGCIWFDDLGLVATSVATHDATGDTPSAWLAGPYAAATQRRHAQHKGSFGDVAVIGGAPGMTGAALLAARAAHAAGAGRVYVALLDDAAPQFDAVRPELMFRRSWWQGPEAALAAATVVCGCGGADAVASALPRLLAQVPRLVLDADALNAIAADASLQAALADRAARDRQTVLTPHPLEAARLLGTDTAGVQADRLLAARRLADRFGCTVVLKGSGTIVAAPDGIPSINPTGNAALASAGTGDVLAGWIGGLWASSGGDAFDTAQRAVFLHGLAADHATATPLRAADLIEAMHAAR